LKRIKGLGKEARLVDASFIWTEEHSKRIRVKITEQKEVAGHMMPTFLGSVAKFGSITKVGFKGKRRRITIETYTPLGAEESAKVKPWGLLNECEII